MEEDFKEEDFAMKKCAFCSEEVFAKEYEDHIMCHRIENGENIEDIRHDLRKNNNNVINDDNNVINFNNPFANDVQNGNQYININRKNDDRFASITNKNDDVEEQNSPRENKLEKFGKNVLNFFKAGKDKIVNKFKEIKEKIKEKRERDRQERERRFNDTFTIENHFNRIRMFMGTYKDNKKPVNIDEVLKNLPVSKIKERKKAEYSKNDEDCSICLGLFEVGDDVSTLPCAHVYHSNCIKNWLKIQNTCPLCKLEITESLVVGED